MRLPITSILIVVGLFSAATTFAIAAPMYSPGIDMPQWADYLRVFLVICYGIATMAFIFAIVYGNLLEPGFWRTDTYPSDG